MERILQIQYLEFQVSPLEFTVATPDFDTKLKLKTLFGGTNKENFLLHGTGFSMESQVDRWKNKYSDAIRDGKSLETARRQFISETIQDVIGFYHEYLSGQDIFPIDVDLRTNQKGERVVFATKYHSQLTDVTSPTERGGALLTGIKKVVDILATQEVENSVLVLISPNGWSGWKVNGQEVVYPDNQAYVYYVDKDGDLNSITIRTDMTLEQSERMAGLEPKNKNTKERIKEVVSTPILINDANFDTVLERIEEITGKKFDKIREEIKNRHTLFNLNDEAKTLIKNLELKLLDSLTSLDDENILLFVTEVGRTILELGELTLIKRDLHKTSNLVFASKRYAPNRFDQILSLVQQIPGCNGGGATSNSFVDSTSSLNMVSSEAGGKYVKNCGACGVIIKAFISKGYVCKVCNQTYLGC